MKLLVGLLACVMIFVFSALKWRRSIKAVFLLLVLEGALRKWLLPQASEMIYFLKDIVLLGAYFNFYGFSPYGSKSIKPGYIINILIFMVVGWCLFQVFNPSLGSPLVGIFGLRGYLLYLPLIWIVPYLFESEEELYKFLRSHLLLLIPVCLIGIIQFFSPATSFINAYANEEGVARATFGAIAAVRITGTFSYISGYGVYLIVSFGFLLVFLGITQQRGWKVITLVELFLLAINSFMTGSRSVILAEILLVVGYLITRAVSQPDKVILFLKRLFVPILVMAIVASIWFRPAIEAFWLRATTHKDVSNRITRSFTQPFDFIKYKELDGYGTGATHQAAPTLRKVLDLPKGEKIPTYYESEMGRILLELGPVGFIFWYGLRLSLIIALITTYWKLKTPFFRQLALVAFIIQAIQFNGQLVIHHTFSVYYWFLSSFIFLLPHLEHIENWQKEQQVQQDVLSSYFSDSPYR